MKKNLISVIILALVFANFVLTAILMFSVFPEAQKANKMIESVCSAINLELNNGAGSSNLTIPIEDIENYDISSGETLQINLKDTPGDKKKHYAMVAVSLSLNKESDGYKKHGGAAGITEQEAIIRNDIISIVGSYTIEEFNENPQAVQDEILRKIQGYFGADFIVGVMFSKKTVE